MSKPARLAALAAYCLFTFFSPSSFAETVTTSFTNPSSIEETDGIVNRVTERLEPKLQADDWDDDATPPLQTRVFSPGDGSDGAFNSETRLNFHSGTYLGDQVIRIDTDEHEFLQFTTFTLDENWTIKPTGSKPFVIYVQGDVVINGIIDCGGGDGDNQRALSLASSGGAGICGGGSGGSGGHGAAANDLAKDGSSSGVNIVGFGFAGPADGDGGGGAAGMAQFDAVLPEVGTAMSGSGGGRGTNHQDDVFSEVGAGSGGGGGAHYEVMGDSANHSTGGGGGAGGGSVYIYSAGDLTVGANGAISADGGNGGGITANGKGGGGGGGAGGSILIYALGDVQFNGPVTANGGAGGASDGGSGGDGGVGRTWVIGGSGFATGIAEVPAALLAFYGNVNRKTGTTITTSKLIDTANTKPEFTSASVLTSGTGVATLEIASSDEPFSASAAVWHASTALSDVSGKRYIRFRLTLDNQSETTPLVAQSVTIEFKPSEMTNFKFTSCAFIRGAGGGRGLQVAILFLLFLPIAVFARLRRVPVSFCGASSRR